MSHCYKLKKNIIVIEGLIGIGKSTCGESLCKYLNSIGIECKYFPEYVNTQLLTQFTTNPKKYSYTFQLLMLIRRQELYRNAISFINSTNGVAIIDRGLYGDYTFAKMLKPNFTTEEWKVYKSVFKEWCPKPTYTVFLYGTPEIALKRIRSRNRDGEHSYNLEYLQTLNNRYIKTLNKHCKYITIEYSDKYKVLTQELCEKILGAILEFEPTAL